MRANYNKLKVLSLCDYTGNMVRPWADAGHQCTCIDLQHKAAIEYRDGIRWICADVNEWELDDDYDIAFAFPPCTDLAVSGARWFAGKGLLRLAEAIRTFGSCVALVEQIGRGFAENPVSVISSHFRKPDYTFNPSDYGDPYTKKTCLWTIGDFIMPHKTPVAATLGSKMHRIPPGPDRANLRSETPMGFARAVYEANSRPVTIFETGGTE